LTEVHKAIEAPVKKAKEEKVTAHVKREIKPDEVIPMEDEADFKDL
jgi:predicted transcriptional regulator